MTDSASDKQNLIQDVYVRPAAESRLLRTAIGTLAERWEKRKPRNKKISTNFDMPEPSAESSQFTRVRPLATLGPPRGQYQIDSEVIKVGFDDLIVGLAGLGAALWGGLTNFQFAWLPKKYSTNAGWHTDWSSSTFVWLKRMAIPLMGILLVVLLAVWIWPLNNQANLHGGHNTRIGSSTSKPAGNSRGGGSNNPGPSGSATSGAGGGNLAPATLTSAGSLPASSTGVGTTGGMGGGGSSGGGTTTTSSGGSGSNLLNQSVTVPGTCVDATDKIIACTSPVTGTLDPTLP